MSKKDTRALRYRVLDAIMASDLSDRAKTIAYWIIQSMGNGHSIHLTGEQLAAVSAMPLRKVWRAIDDLRCAGVFRTTYEKNPKAPKSYVHNAWHLVHWPEEKAYSDKLQPPTDIPTPPDDYPEMPDDYPDPINETSWQHDEAMGKHEPSDRYDTGFIPDPSKPSDRYDTGFASNRVTNMTKPSDTDGTLTIRDYKQSKEPPENVQTLPDSDSHNTNSYLPSVDNSASPDKEYISVTPEPTTDPEAPDNQSIASPGLNHPFIKTDNKHSVANPSDPKEKASLDTLEQSTDAQSSTAVPDKRMFLGTSDQGMSVDAQTDYSALKSVSDQQASPCTHDEKELVGNSKDTLAPDDPDISALVKEREAEWASLLAEEQASNPNFDMSASDLTSGECVITTTLEKYTGSSEDFLQALLIDIGLEGVWQDIRTYGNKPEQLTWLAEMAADNDAPEDADTFFWVLRMLREARNPPVRPEPTAPKPAVTKRTTGAYGQYLMNGSSLSPHIPRYFQRSTQAALATHLNPSEENHA